MMGDPGNGAQVRLIAHQLFQEWKAEQGKQRASWPAWLGLFIGVASLIFSAGALRSDQATGQINDRLARIETKLDLALEKRK